MKTRKFPTRPATATVTATRTGSGAGAIVAALAASIGMVACGGSNSPVAAASEPTGLLQNGGCAAVATLNLPGVALETPQAIAAGTVRPGASGDYLPAHCLVRGVADAYIGSDKRTYGTGFELRLPAVWSGRFFFQGGGGNDGVLNPAYGTNTGASAASLGTSAYALARGFAVVSTDGGHQGTDASLFGLDAKARVNHAYASYDRTAALAKTLIANYYGKAPDHSYFLGCSGGGRQGMMFSQRFPAYFDGIIASAPAMQVATGAAINAAHETQVYTAIAPAGADGKPVLAAALSDADLSLVSSGVLGACDALDGVADGQVQKPGCSFDPAVLQCTGAKAATCLSAAQVAAVKSAFAGPTTSGGSPLYSTWPWDHGVADAGWRAWKLGTSTTSTPNSRFVTLIQNATAYEFLTPADPGFDFLKFNFDTDPARLAEEDKIYGTHRVTDLSAFSSRGGKMMFIHGVADPIFSSNDTVDYFKRVQTTAGGTDKAGAFARLFLVPGMGHCSGGPATDGYDGLSAIVDWVEKGVAPESIAATSTTSTTLTARTRPLCAYPKYAKYKGTGNVAEAANFSCSDS